MLAPHDILRLYQNVLGNEVDYNRVDEEDIKRGIREMSEVYKPNKTSWNRKGALIANYHDISHRCAYLHKYAPLHTAMVQEMFWRILHENNDVYDALMYASEKCLKICSLGGGPGTDVIGVLSAMHHMFGLLTSSVQVVDVMSEWEYTFRAILDEFVYGDYGSLSRNLYPEYFNYSYMSANLLGTMNKDVNKAIASADLITMIKFVSAAACVGTAAMVTNIFNSMKPGALVLFIDNAAGGFSEMVHGLGQQCQLLPLFGPLNHVYFADPVFSVERYDYVSCSEMTLTVHMLMKPIKNRNAIPTAFYYNQNMNNSSSHPNFAAPSISNTRPYLVESVPLQSNNLQYLTFTGYQIKNSQLDHGSDVKPNVGNQTPNMKSLVTTTSNHSFNRSLKPGGFTNDAQHFRTKTPNKNNPKHTFSTSSKFPDLKKKAERLRASCLHNFNNSYSNSSKSFGVTREDERFKASILDDCLGNRNSSSLTSLNNNYDTLTSSQNDSYLKSKQLHIAKKGFGEVMKDTSKVSNTLAKKIKFLKQANSKNIKPSNSTTIKTKSKVWAVPISGKDYKNRTQSMLKENRTLPDIKTNANSLLTPSQSLYFQNADFVNIDRTVLGDKKKLDKKGFLCWTKSIFERYFVSLDILLIDTFMYAGSELLNATIHDASIPELILVSLEGAWKVLELFAER